MSSPTQIPPELLGHAVEPDPDQRDLTLFTEILSWSRTAAFADMMRIIDGAKDSAHESLVNCVSGSPEVYRTFTLRYQEALVLHRAIHSWLESAQRGYDEIHERMREDLERASLGSRM